MWSHFKDIQRQKNTRLESLPILLSQISLQIHLIPTLNLIQNQSIFSNYEKHCNPPLHHLTNSYSQKLVFQFYLIINSISSNWWKFQQREKKNSQFQFQNLQSIKALFRKISWACMGCNNWNSKSTKFNWKKENNANHVQVPWLGNDSWSINLETFNLFLILFSHHAFESWH